MKKYKKGSELKPVPSDRPGLKKMPSVVLKAMGYEKKAGGSMGNAMSAVKKGFDQAGALITSNKAYGGPMNPNMPAEKLLLNTMQSGGPMDMVDVIMKRGGCMKCGGSMKKMGGAMNKMKLGGRSIIAKTK